MVGREDNLSEVKEIIYSQNNLLLVNGLGGIGKTTLAKAFIRKYKNNFDHIVWINNSISLRDALISDVVLLHNLDINYDIKEYIIEKKQEESFLLLINKLRSIPGNKIIVLDNVEIKDERYIELIKSLADSGWKILLTSREQIANCNKKDLDVLNPVKARELFLKYYKREADNNQTDILLKYIGYHTLTIELLAKTANNHPSLSVNQIYELLKSKKMDSRKLAVKIKSTHSGENEIEAYSHLISIYDLSKLNEYEMYLLKQFSVLPARDIEFEFLCKLLQVDEDGQTDFINGLNSLSNLGYLSKTGNKFKIHPIIQEIVNYKSGFTIMDHKTLINSVIDLLGIDQDKDNPIDKFPYVDLGTKLLNNLSNDILYKALSDDNISLFVRFLTNLAIIYQYLGRYNESASLLEKALETNINKFGDKHPLSAISQSNLALVYLDLGRYDEAALLLENALKTNLNKLGDEHTLTATTQSNLALVYQDLGRYDKAALLLEKSLETNINKFGDKHPLTAIRQANLAMVYKDLGRYDKAALLLEKSLETNINKFGDKHPSTAGSQSNLALVYRKLGRYDEAALLLEKALETDINYFGDKHPSTARSQSNLALVYESLFRFEEAEDLLEKALSTLQIVFGKEHPKTQIIYKNLYILRQEMNAQQK